MPEEQQVEPTEPHNQQDTPTTTNDLEALKEELARAKAQKEIDNKIISDLRKENAEKRVTSKEVKVENANLLERIAVLEEAEKQRKIQAERLETATAYKLPTPLIEFLGDDPNHFEQKAKALSAYLNETPPTQTTGNAPKPRPVSESYGGLTPRDNKQPFDAAALARHHAKK